METISEEEEKKFYTVYDTKLIQPDKTTKEKVIKFVKRKLPILKWLPDYQKEFILPDLIAGFTVWLTAIPASMGDATIAGVSPEYGLYSAYMGAFVYLFLGSCKELVIGPQAVLSLLSYQACGNNYPECVILLGFYTGCVHLILGILHLGFLVSFISEPVAVGFTAGAAVLIASGQIKMFLGLRGTSAGSNVIPIWTRIAGDFTSIRMGDAILGITSVIVLVTLFKLKDIKRFSRYQKILHILSLSRNAIVMLVSTLLGYLFYSDDPEKITFKITGEVKEGFPTFQVPTFTLVNPKDRYINATGSDGTGGVLDPDAPVMSAAETFTFLGSSPFVIAFIAILQNVAISKKFASNHGQVDATQELIALGVVNLTGAGFFDAIPTSASFSRSAVNASSGVKSHFSSFIAALLMVMSLAFLTPYFIYIPKASLASIIIAAMIFMIDFHSIVRLWKFSKLDLFGGVVTFFCSILLGMEYGIMAGVGWSILVILLKSLRPDLWAEYRYHIESQLNYVFVHTDQGLNFPSVDYIRNQVMKISKSSSQASGKKLRGKPNGNENANDNGTSNDGTNNNNEEVPITFNIIVLDCSMWTKWDYTSVNTLVSLVDALGKSGKICIFYRLTKPWIELLSTYGLENPIISKNMEQLSSILMELKKELPIVLAADKNSSVLLRLRLSLNPTDPDAPEGGRKRRNRTFTSSSLPNMLDDHEGNGHYNTIATIAQFRRTSFNHIRRKYSIQLED